MPREEPSLEEIVRYGKFIGYICMPGSPAIRDDNKIPEIAKTFVKIKVWGPKEKYSPTRDYKYYYIPEEQFEETLRVMSQILKEVTND